MDLKHLILGSHLYFAREGETIDAVLVTATAKPDVVPTTNWTDIGEISEANIEPQVEETEVRAPSPGVYRRTAILQRTVDLTITATVQQGSPLMFELLFLNAGKITADFVPMSKAGPCRGWWKFQNYSHEDELINVMDLWAEASVNATRFNDDLVRYELVLKGLYSPLNSGTISNLT